MASIWDKFDASMGNIEFSKQVKLLKQLKIVDKKINGKKYRIFVKND